MRRLIVNADDFGLTCGVNRAIVEAHERGIVTSATLMANGNALSHAIQLAPSVPRLSVGCHVVLVDGSPVSCATQVSSLMTGEAPRFRTAIADFALHCMRGKLVESEVEAEATAQIRKLQAAGIAISHLDTHKHTHLFLKSFVLYYAQPKIAAYALYETQPSRFVLHAWLRNLLYGNDGHKYGS